MMSSFYTTQTHKIVKAAGLNHIPESSLSVLSPFAMLASRRAVCLPLGPVTTSYASVDGVRGRSQTSKWGHCRSIADLPSGFNSNIPEPKNQRAS